MSLNHSFENSYLVFSSKLLYTNKLFESSHNKEPITTPLKFYQTASQYKVTALISPLKNLLNSPNAPQMYDEFTLMGMVNNVYNFNDINKDIENKKIDNVYSVILEHLLKKKINFFADKEFKGLLKEDSKPFQIFKYIAKAEFYTNFAFAGMFLYQIYQKARDHELPKVYRFSQFLSLIKEKIQKVHELMRLYKKLKPKDLVFDFPEYSLCNSILNNKQNKKNYIAKGNC